MKDAAITHNGHTHRIYPSDFELANAIEHTEEVEHERERFHSQWSFIITCIGFAVGLGNIWRFPSLAYENGGGAFLIPYLCCSLLFGLPMLYFEFILGQYIQRGPSTLFYKIMPAMQGIGWATAGLATQLVIYYNVIVGWVCVYLFDVITGNSHQWTRCDNWWNSPYCESEFNNAECASTSPHTPIFYNHSCVSKAERNRIFPTNVTLLVPAEEYFENYVLEASDGIGNFGGMNWKMLGIMFVLWLLCALILYKGINFIGRVAFYTTLVPYVIVGILFVRGITLEGAGLGLDYYILKPDFSRVFMLTTWKNALTQMCYSLSLGFGGMHSMASYNDRHHNCFRDACILVIADGIMSIIGGLAVFSVLGYICTTTGRPMEEVVQSGTALAFVAYPEAMARMPLSWLWALLFFVMLGMLGISTVVVNVQSVITCVTDFFPRLKTHKAKIGLILCMINFLVGLLICSKAGIYWFTIFDNCTGGFSLSFVIFAEVAIVAYAYGIHNFSDDMKEMFGKAKHRIGQLFGPTGWYFRLNYVTISPIFTLAMIIITIFRPPMSYGKGTRLYIFPEWAEVFGWCLASFVMIFVPIFLVINLVKAKRKYGSFLSAFRLHSSHPSYARVTAKKMKKEEPMTTFTYL